jgi:hypothetical protein
MNKGRREAFSDGVVAVSYVKSLHHARRSSSPSRKHCHLIELARVDTFLLNSRSHFWVLPHSLA